MSLECLLETAAHFCEAVVLELTSLADWLILCQPVIHSACPVAEITMEPEAEITMEMDPGTFTAEDAAG